jgi:hypothetical protein
MSNIDVTMGIMEGGAKMSTEYQIQWITAGIVGGIFAAVLYPTLLIVPGPSALITVVASFLGLSIGVGSLGLMKIIALNRASVPGVIGAISNFTAGAIFTAMALVQLAVKQVAINTGATVGAQLEAVWLGLDVAWDVYIGVGTIFFGWAMLRHPRFRWFFGVPGILLGCFLIILNLLPFPTPPSSAGSIDLGPFVGLWYLAATIQTWRSLGWAKTQLSSDSASDPR